MKLSVYSVMVRERVATMTGGEVAAYGVMREGGSGVVAYGARGGGRGVAAMGWDAELRLLMELAIALAKTQELELA